MKPGDALSAHYRARRVLDNLLKPVWRSVDSMVDLLDSAEIKYVTSRSEDLRQLLNWLRTTAKEPASFIYRRTGTDSSSI